MLYECGRQLLLQGEILFVPEMVNGRLVLRQACAIGMCSWDEPLGRTGLNWHRPDGIEIRRLPAEGVVHARINVDPSASRIEGGHLSSRPA